jgi:hypothetical protein
MNKTFLIALLGLVVICRVACGAKEQGSPQEIRYQCFIIESDKPLPHDISKLSHRKGIDAMSAPVVSGKADQEVAVKIVNDLIPKYVKGQYSNQSLELGLSISLKGIPDQNKIILIGKLRVLDVIGRSETHDSTSLTTITKELYFSKIVENGKEAWLDVDYAVLKPKHLTLRIVPTLI